MRKFAIFTEIQTNFTTVAKVQAYKSQFEPLIADVHNKYKFRHG